MLGTRASVVAAPLLSSVACGLSWHGESSRTRDGAGVPCIASWIPGEAPLSFNKKK